MGQHDNTAEGKAIDRLFDDVSRFQKDFHPNEGSHVANLFNEISIYFLEKTIDFTDNTE